MNKDKTTTLLPKYRFPEFELNGDVTFDNGNVLFKPINNKQHNSDLPVLAITQEYGAIPRDKIDYNVVVSERSLKNYKVVEIGDFIISLRSFEGGIEYSLYHGICSPAYIILRKKVDIVEQYYKYYFKSDKLIQDLNKDLEGIRDGKMVSYNQFSNILLPKPSNKEQQKIADCITSLDELIVAEIKKFEALKNHKNGLMQKLFPTEGKTVPEIRFADYTGTWERRKLGEIADIIDGDRGKNYPNSDDFMEQGHTLFLSAANITKEGFSFIRNQYITEEKSKSLGNGKLQVDDVVVTSRGSLGHAAWYSKDVHLKIPFARINSGMLLLRPKRKVSPIFAEQFLKSPMGQEQINLISFGSAQPQLTKKDMGNYCIPFPSLNEQADIGSFFKNLDELLTAQTEKIETLKLHKKGLIQGLFPSIQEVVNEGSEDFPKPKEPRPTYA